MKQPNVIIILSDDQGYGDVACHGNPWVKTPHLDKLYGESLRLEDFHTDPMCAPTRASLMSGKYSARVGVWSTLNGRYIMDSQVKTMADYFKMGGYRTGVFGKWHLGDNYPNRAVDRGFERVLSFGGGVVGETPDFWDNDYFDDKYMINGEWRDFHGYCTDIWFEGAMEFISDQDERPFFAYIANNAPHGPFNIHTRYVDNPHDALPEDRARFYGMINNIDENLGRLETFLEERNLRENTLLIYMGDNGTSTSCTLNEQGFVKEGYNAGMRGKKCDAYEGGHRNMCFLRWPEGNYGGGKSLEGLTMIMDLLPTFVDICGLVKDGELPEKAFDGQSLARGLKKAAVWIPCMDSDSLLAFEDRTMIVHNMQLDSPRKYKDFSVMTNRWRMVRTEQWAQKETELFKAGDREQKNNLADENPQVIRELTGFYDQWWEGLQSVFARTNPIHIGNQKELTTKLTCHSWHGSTEMTYNQVHIRAGIPDLGVWTVLVEKAGSYRIELRRWPREADTALCDPVPAILEKPFVHDRPEGVAYDIVQASLVVQGHSLKQEVKTSQKEAVFKVNLEEGVTDIKGFFHCRDRSCIGSYYCYVEKG